MASVAQVSVPTFSGLKAQTTAKVAVKSTASVKVAPVVASLKNDAAVVAVATAASVFLSGSALAAPILLGSNGGGLVFVPDVYVAKAGETIVWKNNAGFPHNVVFDEDAIPEGVDADAISTPDYLNAPGEEFSVVLTVPGEYGYYCEPHSGAGMVGKIIVE